jgi:hypothetical protein
VLSARAVKAIKGTALTGGAIQARQFLPSAERKVEYRPLEGTKNIKVREGIYRASGIPDGDTEKVKAHFKKLLEKYEGNHKFPQIAIMESDLKGRSLKHYGFKGDRMAIPLPGKKLFGKTWRSGQLHAHKIGPMYLMHRDKVDPYRSLYDTIKHNIKEAVPAAYNRWIIKKQPYVKTASEYAEHRHNIVKARQETNKSPTKSQIDAGNYKKGKISWKGMVIKIETPKGSIRSGEDESGHKWAIKMKHDYGYIGGGKSKADGDAIDIFMGEHPESNIVYIIDQIDKKGNFDEHKCVLGARSEEEAKDIYLANYENGWKCGKINSMTVGQFKDWVENGNTAKEISKQNLFKVSSQGGNNMPSVSKSQQRAAGMALAAKRGQVDSSNLRGAVKKMYDNMSAGQLREYAKTKSRFLPERALKTASVKLAAMPAIKPFTQQIKVPKVKVRYKVPNNIQKKLPITKGLFGKALGLLSVGITAKSIAGSGKIIRPPAIRV